MFAWTRAVATEMEMMLLNINEIIKAVQDAHVLEAVMPTLPHFTYLKMSHRIGTFSQNEWQWEPWGEFGSLCRSTACQADMLLTARHQLREEGWGWGSQASHSVLSKAPCLQSPHRASESLRVLNKRNEWNRWALSLVMSALVALDGRRFSRVSKAIPSFALFCFVLI